MLKGDSSCCLKKDNALKINVVLEHMVLSKTGNMVFRAFCYPLLVVGKGAFSVYDDTKNRD
ncbi:hypothetical protein J32TS6_34570 [Virgibacillus pantothenticus]|uniref:Uncharacterized protein n=1 Tax=Virgibacillus pantothenticus TaxID=1473 RepID=A0A0L0QSE1_VIRPA|nr:hypothetical protein BKP57_11055 [Virgibacillus sp. 6R]KNE21063.1 hypothetical protein AFK71_05050 [Virgibacillus pantothenticus]GIP64902.1 hypothetical protein J32TS6_34570 [Virgibacillus pantothenticus]SIT06161.1 hypothetical protein SAMN05421787_11319 [Virgibacillus pantothenticus]